MYAEKLSLVAIAAKSRWADVGAIAFMYVSLFGFLGNVAISYNNAGATGIAPTIVNAFAVVFYRTLGRVITPPPNYWGASAFVYFGLFLLAYMSLNRHTSLLGNLVETIRLASFIVILYEIGTYVFAPYWWNSMIVAAFSGTILEPFTNAELFLVSTVVFLGPLLLSMLSRRPLDSALAFFGITRGKISGLREG